MEIKKWSLWQVWEKIVSTIENILMVLTIWKLIHGIFFFTFLTHMPHPNSFFLILFWPNQENLLSVFREVWCHIWRSMCLHVFACTYINTICKWIKILKGKVNKWHSSFWRLFYECILDISKYIRLCPQK